MGFDWRSSRYFYTWIWTFCHFVHLFRAQRSHCFVSFLIRVVLVCSNSLFTHHKIEIVLWVSYLFFKCFGILFCFVFLFLLICSFRSALQIFFQNWIIFQIQFFRSELSQSKLFTSTHSFWRFETHILRFYLNNLIALDLFSYFIHQFFIIFVIII